MVVSHYRLHIAHDIFDRLGLKTFIWYGYQEHLSILSLTMFHSLPTKLHVP